MTIGSVPSFFLTTAVLFVGGSDHSIALPGSRIQSNFTGCFKEVSKSREKKEKKRA
jgi:hypothetical protein